MRKQIPPFLLGETEWPDAITSGDLLFHIPLQKLNYTSNEVILSAPGNFNGSTSGSTRNYILSTIPVNTVTYAAIDFEWQTTPDAEEWLMGGCGNLFKQQRLAVVKLATGAIVVQRGTTTLMTITSYITVGKRYKIKLYRNVNNIRCVIYDYETGTETFDQTVSNSSVIGAYNFCIGASYATGSGQGCKYKLYSFEINTESWTLVSGSSVTGSNGTVLLINGDLTDFWTFLNYIEDVTGNGFHARIYAISEGKVTVRFDYNPLLDASNTALGQLFWGSNHIPNYIVLNDLGPNHNGLNLLFMCKKGTAQDLMLFSSKRTSSTNPSIEEVCSYLQLTPGDILTFNGDTFTFGGDEVHF